MAFFTKRKKVRYSSAHQANYLKSNSINEIDFEVSNEAKALASEILRVAGEEDRQLLSEKLMDELTDAAQINIVKVKISEARQYHKKYNGRVVFKQYGYYRPKSQYIYINNRTAVQGKILAPKTFLNTLLHEWTHHYDHEKLGLNSIHTRGFYDRLKSLSLALLNPS